MLAAPLPTVEVNPRSAPVAAVIWRARSKCSQDFAAVSRSSSMVPSFSRRKPRRARRATTSTEDCHDQPPHS